ncbi:reverse transcriptase domain-containing protein [Tanacetum coccineum]|uniref:Reverse transcriptase domain-containing protein n=1 Tax=Tanacetum coccineum TaxID=301880 RepID=A0ABQ5E6S6_9ASTR
MRSARDRGSFNSTARPTLREAFTTRYSTRKACYKEPHEITKIVRKANETLTAFKERWTVETGFIMGVPEVMKISSFMDSVKSPELAKRFASSVPKTVDEMMRRLDEFVRAEEAYALAELPLGESRDIHRRLSFPEGSRDVHHRLTFPAARRDDRDGRNSSGKDFRKSDYRNSYKGRDNFNTGRHRDYGAPYHQRERTNRPVPVLSLDSLTKCPKEILATETQLQLPPPRPVANPLRTGDPDKYCDYHQDKGHHTNDCIQLRKQLEIALESGKLNHLMKDLRQRVERRQNRNPPVQKVINMVNVHSSKRKKRKDREATESWMNTPISFPPIMTDDASDEPLIIEAEVEGYLVRRDLGVKKCDGSWRMCIDFKNLNSACPKDYYPLPNIDCKVEAVMGFRYKCFLDAYKGYHQIQMAKEDEEKTAFYTEQGTYCYTKMPFGLKNAGATYQRLVDSTFQSQIGRNLEAYVDDMVIKSKEETSLLADIAETFEGLKTINMKLNPKKCSFGVEEGKFLGYMVTSEGIRANPKKTKAISDLQSPKTLKEMQSLSGKLASLNRFLAKSAERALPFFNTLKNITKENKHEYRWTTEAEEAFQQMKRLIMSLPSLTPPFPEETLYAYLAVSREAVSAVLLTDRNGRQCPV